MNGYDVLDKKNVIKRATWEYLLETGLAKASIGELCKKKNLAQSSLYYWYENKDDIWISAGKYGLSIVVEKLFSYTLENACNIRAYFDNLLKEIDKYRTEIRCVVQITVSPVYGERMREEMKAFNQGYADFAIKLTEAMGCSYEQAEYFIYAVLSAVVDYVVWDDGEKTQLLLDKLCETMQTV